MVWLVREGDIGLGGGEEEGEGKDKKQRDVFVPHELLSAKTTFPLFVTVSPLSLSTTRSPLSFGILHHAKLYTTAAFRGKYFENFLLPKSSWFRLTNFLFSLSCFSLFFSQSWRFIIIYIEIDKTRESNNQVRALFKFQLVVPECADS